MIIKKAALHGSFWKSLILRNLDKPEPKNCMEETCKLTADSHRWTQTFCSADLAEQKIQSLREGKVLYWSIPCIKKLSILPGKHLIFLNIE
jgi:hypothetical protein